MIQKPFGLSILILTILITTGCNLPRPAQATATPDMVATLVATQLAAMPTANLEATIPPQPPTPTTAAITPSVSPMASATATPPAGDPRSILGEPTYRDTFSKAGLWGLDDPYDDGHTRAEINNNQLIMTSLKAEGWMGWRTTYPKPGNAYIEAVFSSSACNGGDQYGLVFRLTDDSKAEFFAVTCDGRFSLSHYDGSQFTRLLNWQSSNAVLTGSNQTNRLGVWVEGKKIRLYANGNLLTETTDDQISDQGNFGVLITGIKTVDYTVRISEIAYWDIK
ncbi:MAG TPA: hypothetical protein VN452_08000 [Longilinea sp.]|nr:hypothetical protein [Longilinea sp.]